MAIWIQSLSWTLIYALGQGFLVYTSLWFLLKLAPATSAGFRYHMSLSALTILLAWFAATWWQQFHTLTLTHEQLLASQTPGTTIIALPLRPVTTVDYLGNVRSYISSLTVIFPWLSGLYIFGLALMLVRLLAGMQQLFSFKKSGTSHPGAVLNELLVTLKKQVGLDGPVQLLLSAKAHVPMVIGFLKPVILLPAAIIAQLSTEQLETILLHELAHIKRHDYLVNILQTIVETILFFNPFVWLISAITRREREHCCDDLVLVHTREPLFYATALAALATYPGTASSFTVAASGQPTHLFNRINRIMEMKKNPFSYSRMVAAILIITAVTGSIAWLTPSFARPGKEKPREAAAAKPASAVQKEMVTANQVPVRLKNKKHTVTTTVMASAPVEKDAVNTNQSDEIQLIGQLMNDRLIDQVKGFIVERRQNKLFINGQEQTDEIAGKYLQTIKKETIRVQVYPFTERLQQHPDGSFIEILFPIQFSSPCVQYTPRKDTC